MCGVTPAPYKAATLQNAVDSPDGRRGRDAEVLHLPHDRLCPAKKVFFGQVRTDCPDNLLDIRSCVHGIHQGPPGTVFGPCFPVFSVPLHPLIEPCLGFLEGRADCPTVFTAFKPLDRQDPIPSRLVIHGCPQAMGCSQDDISHYLFVKEPVYDVVALNI